MEQLSWSLSDEVAPYFNSEYITDLCHLIDEKANTGRKYNDLKEMLLARLASAADLNNPANRRAYEFARYY